MSNPAVVKLERGNVGKSAVWLDDNFGESIHIHIDDIRVDLTVSEFQELNNDLGVILNDLLRIENFDVTKIDPVYFSLWLWPKLSKLTRVTIESVNLKDMFIRSMDGKRIEELTKSVELKALYKISNENEFYERKSNHIGQSDTQRLHFILESIKKNGYPYDGKYIIMFGDGNLIRDGQHRASCLYYLYGPIEVPVMRLYFSDTIAPSKKGFLHSRQFYNTNLGYWLRTNKARLISWKNIIWGCISVPMRSILRSLGINRRVFHRNISKVNAELDTFASR